MNQSSIVLTGIVGVVAATLTGVGEFLLHYDPAGRFSEPYQFFLGISGSRTTLGHFFGVAAAPLYLVGCWHMHLMLRPASLRASMAGFFIAAYGFMIGAVWIGSRASISALINGPVLPETTVLVNLYDIRYETLLQAIRTTVLIQSVIFVWLTLTGRSLYPKWMAVLNPITLIVLSFLIYVIAPQVGKFLMPIALNVAFFLFFLFSTAIAAQQESS